MDKIVFTVRMWDPDGHQTEDKFPAATANQALMRAISEPKYGRYIHFGLVGRDRNCHVWKHRYGHPNINPERTPIGELASRTPDKRATQRNETRAFDVSGSTMADAPVVHEHLSIEKLADITMQRALPQLSATEPFTARAIGLKLPRENQHQWTPEVWTHVVSRLRAKGVLLKLGAKHQYVRNPNHVGVKMVDDETPAAVSVGHGNGAIPEAVAAPAAEPAPVAQPAPPTPSRFDLGTTLLTTDDKIEGILLLTQALLLDTNARKQTFMGLADRVMNVLQSTETLLETIDKIREDVQRAMQEEAALPTRAAELVTKLRGVPSMSRETMEAAH
jgi:hypothetical protein